MRTHILSVVLFFIVSLLFFHNESFSQNNTVSGKVIDAQTKQPLAFVNILVNAGNQVWQTDIDGVFNINIAFKIDSLRLSYVGFEQCTYNVGNQLTKLQIAMKKKEVQLQELVVLPGENPAHRIINRMIENRNKNNPEKMGSFSFTTYSKMVFLADTSAWEKDSVIKDTLMVKAKKFFDKQHLFLMETVTERKFLYPDKNSEKLVASKISGFKDPLFALLSLQLQSLSFYNDIIQIGDKVYLTPVSVGSTNRYIFLLEDTLYHGNDSIYVISYRPRKNRNFDGLKGVLYINTNGFAIQNVIAEPAVEEEGGMAIKIQQQYEFVDNKQWFPKQLNTDFIFKNVELDKMKLVGESRSYLRDIVLNSKLNKSDFSNVVIQMKDKNNAEMDDSHWNMYRADSLSAKDRRTYRVIDSLGRKAHLDRLMRSMEALMTGNIPFKIFDIDINRLLRYNDHEGFRVGLGVHTNYKISSLFVVGGYAAYGFRDQQWKGGLDASLLISREHDIRLGGNYMNDRYEAGGICFYEKLPVLNDDMYRKYLIKDMDKVVKKEAFIGFTALRYLKAKIGLSQTNKTPTYFGTSEKNVTVLFNTFHFTELNAEFCYSYKEKFIQTQRNKISLGTNYPIVWFNYIKGLGGFGMGDYVYNRFDMRIRKSFFMKNLGITSLQLQAGYIDGNIPYCNLYNGIGSYRQFTIFAPHSFATMRMNEFLSNRYAALFFTHNFGKLLFRTGKFAPDLLLAANACIGDLKNGANHYDINFNTLQKGYTEAGILINNLIRTSLYGIGVGAYYRLGSYMLPEFKNNIALKVSIDFGGGK